MHQSFIKAVRRKRCAEPKGEVRNTHKTSTGKPERKSPFGKLKRIKLKTDIK